MKQAKVFSKANVPKYVEERIDFYKNLKSFVVDPKHISEPIIIDKRFMNKLNREFEKFLIRRLETERFTTRENNEYKALLKKLFPQLEEIISWKNPAIYWFTIRRPKGLTNDKIIDHYSSVRRGKTAGWWAKARSSQRDSTTDILYLGKTETAFLNRFIGHIGLGHNDTSSLKLQRWMTDMKGLSLTFQFLKLDQKWKPYTEDIEKVLWDATEPLLGAIPRIKNNADEMGAFKSQLYLR